MTGPTTKAVVSDTLPNQRFLCTAEDGEAVTCHVGGDMRLKAVRILPGDPVVIERSPVDPTKGRIVTAGNARAPRSGRNS